MLSTGWEEGHPVCIKTNLNISYGLTIRPVRLENGSKIKQLDLKWCQKIMAAE